MEVHLLKSTSRGKNLRSVDCDQVYGYILVVEAARKKAIAAMVPQTSKGNLKNVQVSYRKAVKDKQKSRKQITNRK